MPRRLVNFLSVYVCVWQSLPSLRLQSTVGDDLQVVKQDQLIRSDPGDYKRRRTIVIQRAHGGSCGFTLQVLTRRRQLQAAS